MYFIYFQVLDNNLPITDFYSKYGSGLNNENYKLNFPAQNVPNMNEKSFLDEIIHFSLSNLKKLEAVPNVEYNIPEEMYSDFNNEVKSAKTHKQEHQSEFYDNDDYIIS